MKKKLSSLLLLGMFLFSAQLLKAQNCIQTYQYPTSFTVAIASTGSTQIETCNYAGDYAPISISSTGSYVFYASGSTYITVTDNSNNPIGSGWSPLGLVISASGNYRVHYSTGPGCGTASSCLTTGVAAASFCTGSSQYPSNTININSSGNTQVTTCNYAGEYSVNNFTLAGQYTVTGTGGSGSYFTVKNAAGTIIYASGVSPLVFQIPATGIYRIHITTSGPTGCGTDSQCHTVDVTGPVVIPPPANNNCTGATPLSVNTPTGGTTLNATTESPNPGNCGTTLSQPGVWYSVTGTGNRLGASLCGTSWDSKIFVYSGSCGALSCVTGTDDNGPFCSGTAASATWCSVSGTNYKILVTGYGSASNFTITLTETVTPTPTVVATAATGTVCPFMPEAITASGATTYSWSTGATTSSITVNPSATSTYTVYGTAGCKSSSTTVAVTVDAAPAISVVMTPTVFCAGSSATLTASGANTFTWSTNTVSNAIVVNPSSNTTYTVSGTGSQACNGISMYTVNVNPLPVVTAPSGSICAGGSFTITPGGASTYSVTGNNLVVTPNVTTSYSVTGVSSAGCTSSAPTVVDVTVHAVPQVSVNSGAICQGQPFFVTPTGATSYSLWGFTNPVIPNVTTAYTVTGISGAGCESAPVVSDVTVMPLPLVAIAGPTLSCSGQTFTLTASGASTYTWSTQSNAISIVEGPNSTTSYFVIGTDANGCVQAGNITVSVNPSPALTLSSSNTLLCTNQSAVLTAGGASTYTWNTNSNLNSITVSPSVTTIYSVSGENTVNCIVTKTMAIVVNTIVVTMPSDQAICAGKSTSLAILGASTHSWSGNPSPFYFINVTPSVTTSYTVGATDANKCQYSTTVTITVNPNPVVMASTGQATMCAGETATLTASGATTFSWSNSLTGSEIAVSPTVAIKHNFIVTGTDGNGCSDTAKVSVVVDRCLGIQESERLAGLSVFPNPGNGLFTIRVEQGDYTLKVTDVSGRLVAEAEFNGSSENIDLRDHANGLYYLQLSNGIIAETVKLIKQ